MPVDTEKRYQALFARLKLRHLRLLDAIAEARSVSTAAAQLHITQPAVSKGLRELEDIVGIKLFERGPSGLTLTPSGRALVTHSKAIQSEIRHAADEIGALSAGTTGTVTIGSLLVSLPRLLPRALRLLRDRAIAAPVRIVDAPHDMLLSQLRGGDIDFLVGRLAPSDQSQRLAQEVLYYEPIVVVAGAGHRLAKKSKVDYDDLARAEWVFPPPDSVVHGSVMQLFTQYGLTKPGGSIEATSYLLVRSLLIDNGMVAALPASVVAHDVKSGDLRILGIRFPQEALAVGITTNMDRTLSATAIHMVQCLRDAAKTLRPT
jgi:DNA-binding transcriptional LysR family regulator